MQPSRMNINSKETIEDRRLSADYHIRSKAVIDNMEKMADAIERIHIAIDTQKDPKIIDWQRDTNLSLRRLQEKANIPILSYETMS